MSDDRQFKIRITTEADLAGAREQANALKDMGQKGVEANQSIAKETEGLTLKKTELRAAVRGLHHEFPELGSIAHLALHPIGLAVAGITGAFAVWQNRVEEMTKALAGVELPEGGALNPKHMSAVVD